MPGTKLGGQKAAQTNKEKYGEEFYAKIGAEGGRMGTTGGFYYAKLHNPEWLSEVSKRGGKATKEDYGSK